MQATTPSRAPSPLPHSPDLRYAQQRAPTEEGLHSRPTAALLELLGRTRAELGRIEAELGARKIVAGKKMLPATEYRKWRTRTLAERAARLETLRTVKAILRERRERKAQQVPRSMLHDLYHLLQDVVEQDDLELGEDEQAVVDQIGRYLGERAPAIASV